jgi:hypothetical protein
MHLSQELSVSFASAKTSRGASSDMADEENMAGGGCEEAKAEAEAVNQTITTDAFSRQNPVCAEGQELVENMGGRSLKPAEGGHGRWNGNAGTGGTPKRLRAAPPEPSQGLRGACGGVALFARLACPSN